jgi:hypothetical protein
LYFELPLLFTRFQSIDGVDDGVYFLTPGADAEVKSSGLGGDSL